MSIDVVSSITRETLYVVIVTAAPVLVVSLIVGLAVSIFMTVTSIQEQTLTFIPKVLSIFLSIMILGHWMMNNMVNFMVNLWQDFSIYVK